MVAPLLLAGGVALGISALYHTGKAVDNVRFWNDYYHRYGFRPKYPFARGSYDYMNYGTKAFWNSTGVYGMFR